MVSDGTLERSSPFADFLRARVERILSIFDAVTSTPGSVPGRRGLERFLRALDELAAAAHELGSVHHERPARREPDVIAVAGDDRFADDVRTLVGPDVRVVSARAGQDAELRGTLQQRPGLVLAAGPDPIRAIQHIREQQPGLPAIAVLREPGMPAGEALAADPIIILRDPSDAELAMAVRAMIAAPAVSVPTIATSGISDIQPRSYAHLAGLLPRALDRILRFDVGAAVIARPGSEPVVDVHATAECPQETLDWVRQRALTLYRLVAGGLTDEADEASRGSRGSPPVRSSMYFPLASEGIVVGLTYLASYRPGAFSPDDERVLAELATHASGAYRRVEGSVHRLRLTPRQSQVLALIASGLSDKEVASRLGLAHRTVRTHVDRLLREHGLRSRTEAVAAWLRGQQE
jgi:DNA-binding CsgD family transcriptional regulator